MNDVVDDDFDRADHDIFSPDVSDAALEAAADPMDFPTLRTFLSPMTYFPPVCC